MSEDQLRDEILTLLGTGSESTSNALACAFYWIHKLPEVKEKLMQEIEPI